MEDEDDVDKNLQRATIVPEEGNRRVEEERKEEEEEEEEEGVKRKAAERRGGRKAGSEEVEGKEGEENSPIPIDRGWAWMVVVGCFGMHVLVVGGLKSFGVLLVEVQELLQVSARQLGLIHGLAAVLMMGLGPVSNALSVRFSCRAVVMAGGVLLGCGYLASAFVPSAPWLYLTYSTLTGLGSAFAYAPSVVMVGHHFSRRRALANGISVSGSALGSFLMPNLVRYLLTQYGLRGALATLGAIMFHVCACAALFRPLTSYREEKTTDLPPPSVCSLNEESTSACLPQQDGSVRSFSQPAEDDDVAVCPSPRGDEEEEDGKPLPLEDEVTSTSALVQEEDFEEELDELEASDGCRFQLGVDRDAFAEYSPTSPVSPGFDLRNAADPDRGPDLRTPASVNGPVGHDRKTPDLSHGSKLQRLQAFDRGQTEDSEVDVQESSDPRREPRVTPSPDLRLEDTVPKSPTVERMERPETSPSPDLGKTPSWSPTPREPEDGRRSPNPGIFGDGRRSPNFGRVGELRKSPNIGRREDVSRSEGNSPSLSRRNGPLPVPPTEAEAQKAVVTINSIRDSLDKKLSRNSSVSSMIAHYGSMKQRPQERTGSFKLNFRQDSAKSRTSGSLKRRAFKGGKPILERHPSALWDARVPESLKQAIEEEKRLSQKSDSMELALLQRDSSQDLLDTSSLKSSGSRADRSSSAKRFGTFKAIDAARPIRFIQERNKLLLANNFRYRSETRDAGVATPTLVTGEKVPLKRFYSVEAGHPHPHPHHPHHHQHRQPSPVLQESFLHRRIRQVSRAESWRSESSVFASAGDLALASLQNISASALEADDDDVFSDTSRVSGFRGFLRLSSQTVYKGEKKKTSVPLFELSLLLNPVFLVFFVSLVCMNFGYPNIFLMLPSYCQQEVGMDKTAAAFVVSLIGLTDLVGRLFIGWFSDLRLFPRKYGFMVSLGLAGTLCSLLPRMKTIQGVVLFATGFGFCGGSFIALVAVVLVDFLGKERLASSFGLASVAMAVGLLAGPAIYGDIRDTAGSWDSAFVVCGLMCLAAASCIFIHPLARYVTNRPIKTGEPQVRDEML